MKSDWTVDWPRNKSWPSNVGHGHCVNFQSTKIKVNNVIFNNKISYMLMSESLCIQLSQYVPNLAFQVSTTISDMLTVLNSSIPPPSSNATIGWNFGIIKCSVIGIKCMVRLVDLFMPFIN